MLAHFLLHVVLERSTPKHCSQAQQDPPDHVVFRIAPSASENRAQLSRCSTSCLRPAVVSEYTFARRPFGVSCHSAFTKPRSSSRYSAGYSDPAFTCRTSDEMA